MDNIKLYKAIKKKLFLCNRNTDFLYMYKKNAFKMITHIKKYLEDVNTDMAPQ